MGMALAAAARAARSGGDGDRGERVLPEPAGVKRIDVETTAELSYETVERFETQHVLLMAAAPADFRTEPITGQDQAPGQPQSEPRAHRGHPHPDRGRPAARVRPSSASPPSTGATRSGRARAKLARKGADLIVLNDVSDPTIGFESAENAVTLIDKSARPPSLELQKDTVADIILDRVYPRH